VGGNTLGLVFTTGYCNSPEPGSVNRALLVLARRCGLRPLHPRALRHSCATFLKAKKVDVMVIRDILGHSQLSITADICAHVLTPEVREAVSIMDGVMGAKGVRPAQTADRSGPLVSHLVSEAAKGPATISGLPAHTSVGLTGFEPATP